MHSPPRLVTLCAPGGAAAGSDPRAGAVALALGHIDPNPPDVPRWLAPERAWPHRRHDGAALAHVRALCGVPPG
jgi:hypothetical protein